MEHLDGLDVAKHEGPEQVVDEVGKPGLDVEAAEPELVLGVLGLVRWRSMLGAWRWVVLGSALAGAVLTPSTDPITMLLLASAITGLFVVGVGLVALTEQLKPETP